MNDFYYQIYSIYMIKNVLPANLLVELSCDCESASTENRNSEKKSLCELEYIQPGLQHLAEIFVKEKSW